MARSTCCYGFLATGKPCRQPFWSKVKLRRHQRGVKHMPCRVACTCNPTHACLSGPTGDSLVHQVSSEEEDDDEEEEEEEYPTVPSELLRFPRQALSALAHCPHQPGSRWPLQVSSDASSQAGDVLDGVEGRMSAASAKAPWQREGAAASPFRGPVTACPTQLLPPLPRPLPLSSSAGRVAD